MHAQCDESFYLLKYNADIVESALAGERDM
jgi:hypothetical protein